MHCLLIALLVNGVNPTIAALPSDAEWVARAERFKMIGLIPLAREQYLFLLKKHPKDKKLSQAIDELSVAESRFYVANGQKAKEAGALRLAVAQYKKAAAANPSDPGIKTALNEIEKELALREGLRENVTKEVLAGIKEFQSGYHDRALEHFVRALNMDPRHKGALHYVDKIGEKWGVNKRP